MRQFLSIVDRDQSDGVGGVVPDINGPFSIVIDELAKQLPVVLRCVRDELKLLINACQEPESSRPGLDDRCGELTAPELGSKISFTNSLQSSSRHASITSPQNSRPSRPTRAREISFACALSSPYRSRHQREACLLQIRATPTHAWPEGGLRIVAKTPIRLHLAVNRLR